jgi:hypothetical protein
VPTVPIPTDEQLLPPPKSVEIATYAMGVYLSELNRLSSRVERETRPLISLDEYRRLRDSGVDLDELLDREFNPDPLLRLVAFTADALQDAEQIREQASELQRNLLAELHEMEEPNGLRDPDGWRAYEGRIRDWHRAQANRRGGGYA